MQDHQTWCGNTALHDVVSHTVSRSLLLNVWDIFVHNILLLEHLIVIATKKYVVVQVTLA